MKNLVSASTRSILALLTTLSLSATAEITEEKIAEMSKEAQASLVQNGFSFSFPDLKGNAVTSDDKQFEGKVVLVDFFGTWCAPCRREAPFLGDLHKKYRKQGLEVVSVAFEFGDSTERNIEKVEKYHKEFKVKHTTLYAGPTNKANELVPPIVARLGYPTVILIDRQGVVQLVEAGFYEKTAEIIESKVKTLLEEKSNTAGPS